MLSVFQAREEYDDALSSGQQAFLLEESEQSPDVFSLSVGSLPPGESASIRLEYVTELAVQADEGLRFLLPAVLNPRYQPQGRKSSQQLLQEPSSFNLEHNTPVHVNGLLLSWASYLNVFTSLTGSVGSEGSNVQVTSVPASLVPYTLSFSARVSSPRPVSKVESSSPLDPLQYLNTEQTQAKVGRVLLMNVSITEKRRCIGNDL